MAESFPKMLLWLATGLVLGTCGGYFWGADSQTIPVPPAQVAVLSSAHLPQTQSTSPATGIAAAINNPTGLQLVGTLVQPDPHKSKAWVLQTGTETTQTYAEGDLLPGGYQLISIGAEDLQISKDGYHFALRRSASSSQNTNAPCEASAQGTSGAGASPQRHANHQGHRGGLAGARRGLANGKPAAQGAQAVQSKRKVFTRWGNKIMLEQGEGLPEDTGHDDTTESSDSDGSSDVEH